MIFRAMCSAHSREHSDRSQDERVVFVDADNRDHARQSIPQLLAAMWRVLPEEVEVWNLESEFQLQGDPYAASLTPEQALFVVGGGGGQGPSFLRKEIGHPLFLLSRSLDRVTEAYIALQRSRD